MSPTGDLLVTAIFVWGGRVLGLPTAPHVLRWHGTKPGAAHPLRVMNDAAYMMCAHQLAVWF